MESKGSPTLILIWSPRNPKSNDNFNIMLKEVHKQSNIINGNVFRFGFLHSSFSDIIYLTRCQISGQKCYYLN